METNDSLFVQRYFFFQSAHSSTIITKQFERRSFPLLVIDDESLMKWGKARNALVLYLKMETSGESFSLFQLIVNDCAVRDKR